MIPLQIKIHWLRQFGFSVGLRHALRNSGALRAYEQTSHGCTCKETSMPEYPAPPLAIGCGVLRGALLRQGLGRYRTPSLRLQRPRSVRLRRLRAGDGDLGKLSRQVEQSVDTSVLVNASPITRSKCTDIIRESFQWRRQARVPCSSKLHTICTFRLVSGFPLIFAGDWIVRPDVLCQLGRVANLKATVSKVADLSYKCTLGKWTLIDYFAALESMVGFPANPRWVSMYVCNVCR